MKKDYTRQQVFNKFGGKCAYCGCDLPGKGWHIDHAKPVVRLYKTVKKEGNRWNENKRVFAGFQHPENDCFENCLPSCASCNINKHGDSIEMFRASIQGYLNSLNERFVQYKMAKKYGLVIETGQKIVFYFEKFSANKL